AQHAQGHRAARDHHARGHRGDARVVAHARPPGGAARPRGRQEGRRLDGQVRSVARRPRRQAGREHRRRRRPQARAGRGTWTMSHFTKCELKLTNLVAIKKALADMQMKVNEAAQGQTVVVRGYRGDTLQAALSIDMGTYDIGVLANPDGTYELTADWWGVE